MIVRMLEADEVATAFDFHDPAGATTPYGILTEVAGDGFDEGEVDTGLETFEADLPGGIRVHDRDGLSLIEWTQELAAPSMDVLEQGHNEMLRLLRDPPGPLRLQKVGGTALYVDVLGASSLVPMLRGQERALFLVETQRFVLDYPISLVRQPGFRMATLVPAVNGLANPTLLLDSGLDGLPDGWTSVAGTHSIVAEAEAYQNSHSADGILLQQDFAAVTPGLTWTASVDARRISGTGTPTLLIRQIGGTPPESEAGTTSAAWTRLSASLTTTAGVSAIRVALVLRAPSGAVGSQFRRAQLEQDFAASPFRVGARTLTLDPTVA